MTAPTLFFRDYSQYNGVVPDPYPIRIARATIGLVKDTNYEAEKRQAAAENDFFVAYHFLNHDSLENVEAQADFAFSVVGKNVPLMLDWEANRGMSATVAHAQRFINRYRSHGGIVHTYYLPHWYWQGNLGSPSLTWFNNNGMSLVSSNYTTYTDSGPGWNSYGGATPVQWQFTSTPFDTNAFRGTVTEYERLVAPELFTPPAITPPPPVATSSSKGSPMFTFKLAGAGGDWLHSAHVNPAGQMVLVYVSPAGEWGETVIGTNMVPGASISGEYWNRPNQPVQYHLFTGAADNGNTVVHVFYDTATSAWGFDSQGH